MQETESRCCVCRARDGVVRCDNCDRKICSEHESRNELTGAPLCRLCHHWLDLPTLEVLVAAADIAVATMSARWSRSFDCPDCGVPMARGLVGRVSLDCCASCGGFWFDRTQLSVIISQYELYPSWQTLPVRMFSVSLPLDTGVCPSCRTQTLAIGTWDARRIEQCRRCIGLWLSPKPVDAISRLIDFERRSRSRGQAQDGDAAGWSAALHMAKQIAVRAEAWSSKPP